MTALCPKTCNRCTDGAEQSTAPPVTEATAEPRTAPPITEATERPTTTRASKTIFPRVGFNEPRSSDHNETYLPNIMYSMMHDSELWPVTKAHEGMLNTAEKRMLRWACGFTRRDKVYN
ncbi:hypothetical protein ANCCEY_07172 [Ancylostoma ceylanicum]|uniref:ShKT domain-containing protein n=1 Tax=Ancylostoma ceylanicum TaxID=53326 RepID=A0A0D6LNS3_9BILA|nr:hypothetical protein ANCCEY_07172 [Ancylostoma ceylanicum]